MKRNSRPIINSGAYTSPNTLESGHNNGGEMAKSPTNHNIRRHVSAAALNSGRGALTSKWDDAERWITSPVSSNGKSPFPLRRPLGGMMGNSPLTTGVLLPDGLTVHYDNGGRIVVKSDSLCDESNVANMSSSSSVPGFSDLISETSRQSSSQDDKPFGVKEEDPISHGVNRMDMATQMSPNCSSSRERLSFSDLPSTAEVRDVQVDKGITANSKQGAENVDSSCVRDVSLLWNASEASKNTSKLQRAEAKINAWENLQKARAEAAIQKLEMKLEKKRSESMDKILNKLRASQMKAQRMRSLLSESDSPEARMPSCSIRKYVKVQLWSNWFVCHKVWQNN